MKSSGAVKFRKDLFAELDVIQPNSMGTKHWTDETDAWIKRGWRTKRHYDFIEAFRKKFFYVGRSAMESRAKELGV